MHALFWLEVTAFIHNQGPSGVSVSVYDPITSIVIIKADEFPSVNVLRMTWLLHCISCVSVPHSQEPAGFRSHYMALSWAAITVSYDGRSTVIL